MRDNNAAGPAHIPASTSNFKSTLRRSNNKIGFEQGRAGDVDREQENHTPVPYRYSY
jgi:hypothetical protein